MACLQHGHLFPSTELSVVLRNIAAIMQELDLARYRSIDPPNQAPIDLASRPSHGKRGRPRVQPNISLLSSGFAVTTTVNLSRLYRCSPRTLRRRAIEYGIQTPRPQPSSLRPTPFAGLEPTSIDTVSRQISEETAITDELLDHTLHQIIQDFPYFGRRMLTAALFRAGIWVSRARLRASFIRINGAPAVFGRSKIERRTYHVPGANSLWHHDGQHGQYVLA
jgi:hypothetical protein